MGGVAEYLIIGDLGVDLVFVPTIPGDETDDLSFHPNEQNRLLMEVKKEEPFDVFPLPSGEASLLVVREGEVGQILKESIHFHSLFFRYHVDIVAPNATTFQLLPSLQATVAAPELPSVT